MSEPTELCTQGRQGQGFDIAGRRTVSLCRCGHSGNKPFHHRSPMFPVRRMPIEEAYNYNHLKIYRQVLFNYRGRSYESKQLDM